MLITQQGCKSDGNSCSTVQRPKANTTGLGHMPRQLRRPTPAYGAWVPGWGDAPGADETPTLMSCCIAALRAFLSCVAKDMAKVLSAC
jgi:hypothetical protein